MPSYRFIGAYPRFYPQIQDAEGKSLMAELGDVAVFDGAVPEDGQWVLVEGDDGKPDEAAPEVPAAGPEPAAVAVEPEPAPESAAPVAEPAPVVSEPTPEVAAVPEVPAEPVPVPVEAPVPAPPVQPVTPAQGFALGLTPFARS